MSFFAYRKLLPNLINSSWLWWIIRRVLANQRRRNIFEWILMIIVIIIISIIITLQWVNIKKWERGSDGHFHTNHWSLSTRASSWCFIYRKAGKVYCVGHVDASVVRCICITISLQPRLFRLLFYLTSFNQHVVKREMRYSLFCNLIAIRC